jgi:Ni/Fe-hydrogenase 1 B-type cytochrome subunit
MADAQAADDAAATDSTLVRAYVWELPVRVTHWVIVACVAVLAVTGYYVHNPFLASSAQTPFEMATIRFIHVVTGFVFLVAFAVRIYWMFAGNYCSRWPAFVPLRRQQWAGIGEMFLYYTFLRWHPAYRIGHNALAAATYLFIFFIMLLQILSGLALFNQVLPGATLGFFIGWLPRLVNIQYLREGHYFAMFGLIAFAIHHVYSAALVSAEEQNGLIESIFTGYKFVPRRALYGDFSCAPPGSVWQPVAPAGRQPRAAPARRPPST